MKEPGRDPRDRLLDHLLDAGDEEQRQEMEIAALEDDAFFDQLRAAEAELVDSYVRGDLTEPESLRLAELIGRSQRLQESAETTLALHARESGVLADPSSASATGSLSNESQTQRRPHYEIEWGLVFAAVLLALWSIFSMYSDLQGTQAELETLQESQRSLESEVQLMEREIERLQEEQIRWQRRWAETAVEEGQ